MMLSTCQWSRQQWPILRIWIRNMIVKKYKYFSLHTQKHSFWVTQMHLTNTWHCSSCLPATVFLEFWKRRRAVLAYDWDLVDWEEEEVKYLLIVDGCEKESTPPSAINNSRYSRHKLLLSSHLKASRWMKYVRIKKCDLLDVFQKVFHHRNMLKHLLEERNWSKHQWIM